MSPIDPKVQRERKIAAIVTELELIGYQGAEPVAQKILKALNEVDKSIFLQTWAELGKMAADFLDEHLGTD